VGRKRKPGARYPSGKLKPATKPSTDPISGAEWQRIRQFGRKLGGDPRLASELSRLNLFGELTILQTTAGQRVGEIYGRYEGLAGLRRSVRSPSYERAYGDTWGHEEAERAASDAFVTLQKTLDKLAPAPSPIREGSVRKHYLVDALEQLCVENRAVSPVLYPEIRSLLEALAEEWGLSTVRRHPAGSIRQRQSAPAPAPAKPRLNIDRLSWLRVMRAMRPDLTDEQLEAAYELAQAHKQREVFRRAKRDPRSNVVRLPSLKGEPDASR
jgi:hypothetical protein